MYQVNSWPNANKPYFLENETLNEQILFFTFYSFLHVE